MVKAEVKSTIKFPDEFCTQEELHLAAKDILIPELVRNIDNRTSIDGGPLPALEPITIRMTSNLFQRLFK